MEEQLPALFENLKNSFPKLDDEIIWSVMTMFSLDGNWDTLVITKLLEISGETLSEEDKHVLNLIESSQLPKQEQIHNENDDDENDDDDSVYVDNTLPMISDNNNNNEHHSDMNSLKKRNTNKGDFDWDEFDKDFNFNKKKKDEGINFSRFMDSLSNLWNGQGSSSTDGKGYYEMTNLSSNKEKKDK
jgi:hypothetical protein